MKLYNLVGCWSCQQAMRMLWRANVRFERIDNPDPGWILEAYPQVACGTCLHGVRWPVVVDGDGVLIGGVQEVLVYVGNKNVDKSRTA